MKPYFIQVNNGKRAGPITEHTGNFMLRVFECLPDAHVVEVFSSLDATAPRARYVRDGADVRWFSPIKSRRHRKEVNVRRSPNVGRWVDVGIVEFTEPDLDSERPTSVCSDDFLADLIEHPYAVQTVRY